MADAAAARREARRRRILENSQNRLQLISGKSVDTIRQESPSRSSILEDSLEDLPSSVRDGFTLPAININSGVLFSELESLGLLSTSDDVTAAGDGETTNELVPPTTAATEVVGSKSLLEKLVDNKFDVVFLSLFIQFLYSCSLFSVQETYFFLPLVMYDVTKLIWFPPQLQSQMANVFLMMQGVSGDKAQTVIKIWQCIQEVILDGCVYLFTVICIQSLLIGMNLVT